MELLSFCDILTKIPTSDWQRNWPADRTIMMSMTSNRVKEIMNIMNLPLAINLKRLLGINNNRETIISHSIFVMKSFKVFLSNLNNKYTIISFDMRNIQVINPVTVFVSLYSPHVDFQSMYVEILFFNMINMIVRCSLYTITNIDISTVCYSVFGENVKKIYNEFKKCKKLTFVNFRGMQINFISSPQKICMFPIDESDRNYHRTYDTYDTYGGSAKFLQIFCPSIVPKKQLFIHEY
jgi:hypothetical protein